MEQALNVSSNSERKSFCPEEYWGMECSWPECERCIVFFRDCAFVHVKTSGYPALALVDWQTNLLEQKGHSLRTQLTSDEFWTICNKNIYAMVILKYNYTFIIIWVMKCTSDRLNVHYYREILTWYMHILVCVHLNT